MTMKKYLKTAKGAVGAAMVAGVGGAVVGSMGGSTAGINTFSAMMPAAIGAEMGGNIMSSFAGLAGSSGKKRRKAKRRR